MIRELSDPLFADFAAGGYRNGEIGAEQDTGKGDPRLLRRFIDPRDAARQRSGTVAIKSRRWQDGREQSVLDVLKENLPRPGWAGVAVDVAAVLSTVTEQGAGRGR